MPKYFPLVDPGINAAVSDLLEFNWKNDGIKATFGVLGQPETSVEVYFEDQCIVRLLDDTYLSSESEDSPNEGIIPNHFAYRVEGALFFRLQSELFKAIGRGGRYGCAHYRLLTGWTCLDVVTAAEPRFSIVRREGPIRRSDEDT